LDDVFGPGCFGLDSDRILGDVFIIKIIWAMPSARATPGSLPLGFCFAKNQALSIPIAYFTKL
jgi:hypothetical protein